jgi:hypothetical protein
MAQGGTYRVAHDDDGPVGGVTDMHGEAVAELPSPGLADIAETTSTPGWPRRSPPATRWCARCSTSRKSAASSSSAPHRRRRRLGDTDAHRRERSRADLTPRTDAFGPCNPPQPTRPLPAPEET